MTPSRQVHAGIWRCAVYGERRAAVLVYSVIALAMTGLFFAMMGTLASDRPLTYRIAFTATPMAMLAMFYWLRYVTGAVRQNSPANAHLVPSLCSSVRRTTVAAWCLTLLPLAATVSYFAYPALALVAASMVVTLLGMARGGRTAGTVLYIVLVLGALQLSGEPKALAWLAQTPVVAALAVVSAGLAAYALRAIFPNAGDRHWRLLNAQSRQRISTDMTATWEHNRRSPKRRWLYAKLLKHDLRSGAAPEPLLLHALGPQNHRFDFIVPLAAAGVLSVLLKVFLSSYEPAPGQLPAILIGTLLPALLLMQAVSFHRFVASMAGTRGEQALVRLAPRAPHANRFGRTLAAQFLTICLIELAIGLAFLMAMAFLFGGVETGAALLASLFCAGVAMAGWPLRDYAGRRPDSILVLIVQASAIGAGCVGLVLLTGRPGEWGLLFVATLAGALAILRGRWEKMANAPAPFPAARFA
jgi:hypothetical protein